MANKIPEAVQFVDYGGREYIAYITVSVSRSGDDYINLFIKPHLRHLLATGLDEGAFFYQHCARCPKYMTFNCSAGLPILNEGKCVVTSRSVLSKQMNFQIQIHDSLFRVPLRGQGPAWIMLKQFGTKIMGRGYQLGNVYHDGRYCTGNVNMSNVALNSMFETFTSGVQWNNDVMPSQGRIGQLNWFRSFSPDWPSEKEMPFSLDIAPYMVQSGNGRDHQLHTTRFTNEDIRGVVLINKRYGAKDAWSSQVLSAIPTIKDADGFPRYAGIVLRSGHISFANDSFFLMPDQVSDILGVTL